MPEVSIREQRARWRDYKDIPFQDMTVAKSALASREAESPPRKPVAHPERGSIRFLRAPPDRLHSGLDPEAGNVAKGEGGRIGLPCKQALPSLPLHEAAAGEEAAARWKTKPGRSGATTKKKTKPKRSDLRGRGGRTTGAHRQSAAGARPSQGCLGQEMRRCKTPLARMGRERTEEEKDRGCEPGSPLHPKGREIEKERKGKEDRKRKGG
ncbi:infB, partial [Ophiophagus hannah]